MTSAWLPVSATAITTAVAVFAVWLTSRLALQRAHDERIWTRKADAYSAIFEAIETLSNSYAEWEAEEILELSVSDAISESRSALYREARRKLSATVASNIWILPADVETRITALNKVLTARYESWFESIDAGSHELALAQLDIVEIAKRELGRPRLIR